MAVLMRVKRGAEPIKGNRQRGLEVVGIDTNLGTRFFQSRVEVIEFFRLASSTGRNCVIRLLDGCPQVVAECGPFGFNFADRERHHRCMQAV